MVDTVQFQVKVRYATLIICIAASAIAITLFVSLSTPQPSPQTILQMAAACIALTALIYSAINVQLISQQHQRELMHEKKVAAAELITQWHNPEMAKLTVIGAALRKEVIDLDPKEVVELLNKDKEKNQAMVAILNYLEKMAILIKHEMADEAILKDFFATIVRVYYHALTGFILEKRRALQSEKIFDRFEELAKRWS